jgi:hypothetical protein
MIIIYLTVEVRVPSATVQTDRDLQLFADLQFALIDIVLGESRNFMYDSKALSLHEICNPMVQSSWGHDLNANLNEFEQKYRLVIPPANKSGNTREKAVTDNYFTILRYHLKNFCTRRTIAEAVSRWLSTTAARVRARVWQVGFVVDKVASGRFSPITSVSPAKTVHCTDFSIIITITRGS